jgi:hypothetical protein
MAELLHNHLVMDHTVPECRDFQRQALIKISMDASSADTDALVKSALEKFGAIVQPQIPLGQQLREFVKQHKVVYVLDNVNDYLQLDKLLPTQFEEGSIVIVTSRAHPEAFAISDSLTEAST